MKVVRGDEAKQEQAGAFTGETQLKRLLGAQQPGGMAVSLVHFEDGSRTHWHVHPGEQVLYVLDGEGRVGTADEEIRVGPVDDAPQCDQCRTAGVVRGAGVTQ